MVVFRPVVASVGDRDFEAASKYDALRIARDMTGRDLTLAWETVCSWSLIDQDTGDIIGCVEYAEDLL